MKKTVATLIMTALLSALFAGCIGGGGFGSSGAPRAVVTVNQVDEYTYVFDARDSSGSDLSYKWDFGDGTTSDEARKEHHFKHGDGTYKVRLVIEDSAGTPDVWEDELVVGTGQNRPPVALFDVGARNYVANAPVTVDASASWDSEDDPLRFRWDFNYLMDFDEYEQFREAKAAALENIDDGDFELGGGSGGGGGDGNGDGSPQSAPGSLEELLRDVDPVGIFGHKHAGHGDEDGGGCDSSLFSHVVETDEPVYTLEQGFQDTTCYFIRLQVWDIKGEHKEIISEEIWPVEVWSGAQFPDSTISDDREGFFDFGVPEEVTDNVLSELPDMEMFRYQEEFTFNVPWPVADTQNIPDYIPGGVINLRWEAESDALLGSELELNITTPNGVVLGASSSEGSIRLELHGQDDYANGNFDTPWEVQIIARAGVNIDWQFDYEIHLDTNPFSEWE